MVVLLNSTKEVEKALYSFSKKGFELLEPQSYY
jgi:hypothetical protein